MVVEVAEEVQVEVEDVHLDLHDYIVAGRSVTDVLVILITVTTAAIVVARINSLMPSQLRAATNLNRGKPPS